MGGGGAGLNNRRADPLGPLGGAAHIDPLAGGEHGMAQVGIPAEESLPSQLETQPLRQQRGLFARDQRSGEDHELGLKVDPGHSGDL